MNENINHGYIKILRNFQTFKIDSFRDIVCFANEMDANKIKFVENIYSSFNGNGENRYQINSLKDENSIYEEITPI